jgi:hypothetical protein
MLVVISPAKTLDYESPVGTRRHTQPEFLADAAALNQKLRTLNAGKLARLMGISKQLAELNEARNQAWAPPFTRGNARQALFAFKGDVYLGLDAQSFNADELDYAQRHLRILSGLYGLLRPLDLMQPYRLEMGTTLANPRGKNLYAYWDGKLCAALNKLLRSEGVLVNLASQEYFAAVNTAELQGEVVTPVFKEYKNGSYKVLSFFAKKARGTMAAWIIKNRIADKAALTRFAEDGYRYAADLSDGTELVFTRKAP